MNRTPTDLPGSSRRLVAAGRIRAGVLVASWTCLPVAAEAPSRGEATA